jgi:hypothetical protein
MVAVQKLTPLKTPIFGSFFHYKRPGDSRCIEQIVPGS